MTVKKALLTLTSSRGLSLLDRDTKAYLSGAAQRKILSLSSALADSDFKDSEESQCILTSCRAAVNWYSCEVRQALLPSLPICMLYA